MTMNQVSDVVKKFFEDFERASNTFEGDLLALQFSDPFMAADPDGGIRVVKKDDFIAGTSKRQAFIHYTLVASLAVSASVHTSSWERALPSAHQASHVVSSTCDFKLPR